MLMLPSAFKSLKNKSNVSGEKGQIILNIIFEEWILSKKKAMLHQYLLKNLLFGLWMVFNQKVTTQFPDPSERAWQDRGPNNG